MELLSTEFLSALLAIVVIDLVLAGDNAIVIALAARGLPPSHRKRAIVWGTIGAIIVRSAMTMAVVWLLRIPGLLAIGGSLLVWIAWKLIINNNAGEEHALNRAAGFWTAMKTIIVADALMGLDNRWAEHLMRAWSRGRSSLLHDAASEGSPVDRNVAPVRSARNTQRMSRGLFSRGVGIAAPTRRRRIMGTVAQGL